MFCLFGIEVYWGLVLQAKIIAYLAYIIRFVCLIILFTLGGLSVSIPFSITLFLAVVGAFIGCLGKRISRLGFAFGCMVLVIGGLIQFGLIPDLLGNAIRNGGFGISAALKPATQEDTGECVTVLGKQLADLDNLQKSNIITADEYSALRPSIIKHFEKCNEK